MTFTVSGSSIFTSALLYSLDCLGRYLSRIQIWMYITGTEWGSVAFDWEQFHSKCPSYYSVMSLKFVFFKLLPHLPRANEQTPYLDGLAQERRNSIANALELCLSCTNPSICCLRSLDVSGCRRITSQGVRALDSCRSLVYLDISSTGVTHKG